GGVAVRRDELDELAESRQPSRLRHGEAPVLVACPGVRDAGALDRFRHERLVRGEGLEAAGDHGHLLARPAYGGGARGERTLEVGVAATALAPDAAVVDVHPAVRAALQLGQTLELGVDVEGAGRAAAHDLDGEAVLFEEVPRLHEAIHPPVRRPATIGVARYVRAVSRVALQAAQVERALQHDHARGVPGGRAGPE